MAFWSDVRNRIGSWIAGNPRSVQAEHRGSGHYDIATTNREDAAQFEGADNFDSDRANSPAVRQIARQRSRLETDNNPTLKGAVKTIANYEVGVGPTLHIEHDNEGFAADVEAYWAEWCEATNFVAKLWSMVYARVQDGETFSRLGVNPHLKHPEKLGEMMPVQLDWQPFEADRCYTLWLPYLTPNRIDGIWFDDWGNPTYYDVLRYHPGGVFPMPAWLFDTVPAQYVMHLFSQERPGQHRGMPEFSSSIKFLAIRRRFLLATVEAAETAANIGVLMETNMPPGESADLGDEAVWMRMPRNSMVQLPEGWQGKQLDPKHPAQTYEAFASETLNEALRPASIPLNIGKCDSSRYNMASGQLDITTFWGACALHQRNNTYRVVNPLFRAWYAEARNVYRSGGGRLWSAIDGGQIPPRTILWQGRPYNDREAEQNADEKGLSTGTLGMSDVWARKGINWRTRAKKNAKDLGLTVEKYLEIILGNLTIAKGGTTMPAEGPKRQRASWRAGKGKRRPRCGPRAG